MRELYALLGVATDADARALKRAYYAAAHKTHPDKVTAAAAAAGLSEVDAAARLAQATRDFRDTVLAYEILREPRLRSAYDRLGMVGVHLARGKLPRSASELGPLGERWARRLHGWAQRAQAHVAERGRRQQARHAKLRADAAGKARGEDCTVRVGVDFATLLLGGSCTVRASDYVACGACASSGYAGGAVPPPCPSCAGAGTLQLNLGATALQPRCPHCRGRGRPAAANCSACHGLGHVARAVDWQLRVPPGHPPEVRLRRRGLGAPGPHGGPRGDLLVQLQLAGDAQFWPIGAADVGCRVPLPAAGAGRAGVQVAVAVPDGVRYVTVPATAAVPVGGAKNAQAPGDAAAGTAGTYGNADDAPPATPTTVTVAAAGLYRPDGTRGALHVTLLPLTTS